MNNQQKGPEEKDNNLPIKDFLSRHVPDQVTNSRKLCYRHRPDLIKRRQPDSLDVENAQRVNS
jgi:F-box/WD-40 domain protein MET30